MLLLHLKPLSPPSSSLLLRSLSSSTSTSTSSNAIASSFKSYLLSPTPNPSLLDQIYTALSSSSDSDSDRNLALSSLNLRLSDDLVLSTLSHTPHPSSLPPSSNLLLLRLKFFDWAAHQPHYLHSRSAYHSIFRHLSRHHHRPSLLHWLHHFSLSGGGPHHSHARLHDTLVLGYSLAGRPERALHLLAKMRFRGLDLDSFSYHVLLSSLVDAGVFDLADALTSQIDSRGFHNQVTDCIYMKSLCKQGKLDEAAAFLNGEFRESENFQARAIATATLVHALCREGRFDEAVDLVEEFGACSVYGVWAMNLIKSGKIDSAVEFLKSKKKSEGYVPEGVHYDKLVFELLRRNRLAESYDVLVEMMEEGVVPSRATMNGVLCFFCKAGMVDVAVELYRSRKELGMLPTKWVYNHLVIALCRNGTVEDVCQVLDESMQEGYFPAKQTFSILANMLCREGKIKKLHELLDGARERAVRPTTAILARCISALCKHGELEKAWSVGHIFGGGSVDWGKYRYVYTGLIRAFISFRKVDVLPELIIQMQEAGHTPSRSLYLAVVGSLCEMGKFQEVLDLLNRQLDLKMGNPRTFYNYFIDGAAHAKMLEMAMEVFNRMEGAGVKPTLDTKIILLQGYLKSRRISNATEFFSYLRDGGDSNTKLYNIFISGLCEAEHVEQAMESWHEMRGKGLVPSLQCYEKLVLVLCTAKDYENAVRVLEDFRGTGRPISAFICNVFLLHTLKSRELLRAWVDFRKAEATGGAQGSGLFIGELIAAFSGGIRMKGNLDNLEEDIEGSFPVDIYTYNVLLRGLSMEGKMDYACKLFSRIQNKGYEPNLWTYDIIVHGFCKQGNRREAERWMNEMYRNGYQPTKYTMRQFYNTA